jgi:predicted dehydrogenase
VVVTTPPALHGVVSSAFLKAGFHMLCEKPMTANADQAVALHRDVAVSDLVFAVAHCYTGYPMVREARELVATGALGTIRMIEACVDRPHFVQRGEDVGHGAVLGDAEPLVAAELAGPLVAEDVRVVDPKVSGIAPLICSRSEPQIPT